MRAKKISILGAVFVLTSFLMVNTAFAAWYTCTILKVGVTSTANIVVLTDTAATPAFLNRNYVLNPTIKKELLALALTAYANGKKLQVSLSSIAGGSTIAAAYMLD